MLRNDFSVVHLTIGRRLLLLAVALAPLTLAFVSAAQVAGRDRLKST
jgi:hypothetical protein